MYMIIYEYIYTYMWLRASVRMQGDRSLDEETRDLREANRLLTAQVGTRRVALKHVLWSIFHVLLYGSQL